MLQRQSRRRPFHGRPALAAKKLSPLVCVGNNILKDSFIVLDPTSEILELGTRHRDLGCNDGIDAFARGGCALSTGLMPRTFCAAKVAAVASGMCQMRLAQWFARDWDRLRRGYSLALLRGDLVPSGVDRQALLVLVAGGF